MPLATKKIFRRGDNNLLNCVQGVCETPVL